MNVVGITTRPEPLEKDEVSKVRKGIEYIHLYDEPPMVEMSLDQFEIYALKRLKVRTFVLADSIDSLCY